MTTRCTEVAAPALGVPAPTHEDGRTAAGRLVGIDLARGLAVFGMYAAHVGPSPDQRGVTGFLMELAHGRASALFAFLAGFAVVLITGRSTPKTGLAGRQAIAKVVIRAVVLLVAGTALTSTGTPVEVILAFYGVYFLLVLPLYRLSAGSLAVIAVGAAVIFPQVLYLAMQAIGDGGPRSHGAVDGIVSLLVSGSYPALTWVPFVIVGMAVARLDLASAVVRTRLAVTGFFLAVAGYGGSWLALHLVPGALDALTDVAGPGAASAWWSDIAGYPTYDTLAWLLVASPHSETTLSIVGNTGVAVAGVATCLIAMDVVPRLHALARPAIAVGSMSLTAYVFHIVGIRLLGIEELPGSPLPVLLGFIAASVVFATVWSRFFRRGPLEGLMAKATGIARHIR
ncbi:hypothetical protein GCM10010211_82200 [Streptomyces albospinus]|uniref:DUF418 domain-containing protein n=1 Tax=Streptomyces albospinus TaxID=285515 RepID=A0ABQ2VNM8_9ACTN|nr:DUF418 domain-containing protein [Streptomyces albospinus]GGV02412.1 hypothetical protein GCM10010211_82200 [Streptomyces albospinus]